MTRTVITACPLDCPDACTLAVDVEGEANRLLFTTGITEKFGYQLLTECFGEPDDADRKRLEQFMTAGVRYDGPLRNWQWTDEEARARWQEFTDEKVHDKLEIARTKHYLILFDAGGKLFAKKMEECYEEIRKIYPFDEVEGRRLMPVFLFRTREEYYEYYARIAKVSREQAAATKGHA